MATAMPQDQATCTIAAGGGMTIENCHNVGDMTTANGASFETDCSIVLMARFLK